MFTFHKWKLTLKVEPNGCRRAKVVKDGMWRRTGRATCISTLRMETLSGNFLSRIIHPPLQVTTVTTGTICHQTFIATSTICIAPQSTYENVSTPLKPKQQSLIEHLANNAMATTCSLYIQWIDGAYLTQLYNVDYVGLFK